MRRRAWLPRTAVVTAKTSARSARPRRALTSRTAQRLPTQPPRACKCASPCPAHPIFIRGFTINFTQWPWGVCVCECAHLGVCVPLSVPSVSLWRWTSAFWHSASWKAQVEWKSFVRAFGGRASKSDDFQHLWALGRETLEFWEPPVPWGQMLCLLSPVLHCLAGL